MTSSSSGILETFSLVCVDVFYMSGKIMLVTKSLQAKRMSVWVCFILGCLPFGAGEEPMVEVS